MSEFIWVRNEAVNDIPGRIPRETLPAWEARGWTECAAPVDDVVVDVLAAVVEPEQDDEELPDAEAPAPKPSPRGQSKEN